MRLRHGDIVTLSAGFQPAYDFNGCRPIGRSGPEGTSRAVSLAPSSGRSAVPGRQRIAPKHRQPGGCIAGAKDVIGVAGSERSDLDRPTDYRKDTDPLATMVCWSVVGCTGPRASQVPLGLRGNVPIALNV
jgi:hypothetical protein